MQDVRRRAAQTAEHWVCGSAERVRGWQVYRAVRLGVQDVAVKLLTKVDTVQLDVFIEVGPLLSQRPKLSKHCPVKPQAARLQNPPRAQRAMRLC